MKLFLFLCSTASQMEILYKISITLLLLVLNIQGFSCNFCNSSKHCFHSDSIEKQLQYFDELVLLKLNQVRLGNEKDAFKLEDILEQPAKDHAKYMAVLDELTHIQFGFKKTPEDRMKYYGGSIRSEELILQIYLKNENNIDWIKTSEKVVKRLTIIKAYKLYILSSKYFLIGIGSALNKDKSSLYVTVLIGNYFSYNQGAKYREELHLPYSSSFFSNNFNKTYGFKPYNRDECRVLDRYKDIENLQKSLSITDNNIVLANDDLKLIRKTINSNKDRIAIDVIPKQLFACDHENLVDHNQPNYGVLFKGLNGKQLLRKNIYRDISNDSLEVNLGELKYSQDVKGFKHINDNVDLNLVLIKNNYYCKVVTPSFNINYKNRYMSSLVVDTVLSNPVKTIHEILREPVKLVFRVPFKKNKYNYKTNDIKLLLDALDESKYRILDVKISAFTSIEGLEYKNQQLQNNRANSIIEALNRIESEKFNYSINTSDSWDQFKKDILNTGYDELLTMDRDEVITYINERKLWNKLEPILANHRYAEIEVLVEYDTVSVSKELMIVKKLNHCISLNLLERANEAMKYFILYVLENDYDQSVIDNISIPQKPEYASLRMSEIWLNKYIEKEYLTFEDLALLNDLHNHAPYNPYITYNWFYCNILYNDKFEYRNYTDNRQVIAELYNSSINSKQLNALNFRFLLENLKYELNNNGNKTSIKRLREEIANCVDNENNVLEVADLLSQTHDYEFAIDLLERFIDKPNVSEKLVFMYLALCSHSLDRMYSLQFSRVMRRAQQVNPGGFCQVLKEGYFSIIVFDNPIVKELYCKYCN